MEKVDYPNIMSKIIKIILTIFISCTIWACNSVDNELIDNTISDFSRHINNKHYDSLLILTDSIIKNPQLGTAAINKIRDSIPTIYNAALATMISPQLAAEYALNDILSMHISEKDYVKAYIYDIISWYTLLQKEEKISILKHSIDSCVKTYPIADKAKLYIMATTPKQLGNIIKQDTTNNSILISAIDSLYNDCDLIEFHNALK